MAEFESTCSIEIPAQANAQTVEEIRREEKRRKSVYLRLLARGRESQGKLLEAFDTYLQIAGVGVEGELDAVAEENGLKATPDVWARGRIAAMVSKSDPAGRAELEKRVSARWEAMKTAKAPVAELRKFAQLFGSLLESGRAAQAELARRAATEGGASGFLQAEQDWMNLYQFASSSTQAGEALHALAELYLEKGLAEDAAYCLRELGTQYGEVPIKGRKGSEWLAGAWGDHRLAPYLGGAPRWFGNGPVKALPVETSPGNNPRYTQAVVLRPEGEVLPFFQRLKLSLQFNSSRSNFNQFRMVEASTGAEVLSEPFSRENLLGQPQAAQLMFGGGANAPRMRYQARGHLVLVEALNTVHLLDVVQKHESNRHELWNLNIHNPKEAGGQSSSQLNSVQMPEKGQGSYMVQFQDGWRVRLGESAILGGGVAAVLCRDGLMGLDPLSGRKLWLREDVRGDSRIHGMGENVLVVEADQDGKAKSTRLIRFADGVVVSGTDLSSAYQRLLQVADGKLVHTKEVAEGGLAVVGLAVNGGQELWKVAVPAGTQFAEDEDDQTVSWLEPDGKFRRIDAATGRDLLVAKVDPFHVQGAQAKVLGDPDRLYLLLNKQTAPGSMVASNFSVATGVQQVPANGEFYAFDRSTGKTLWRISAKNQMLITENFDQMPVVLFSSRYTRPGNGNARQNVGAFLSVDKKTGKRLMDEEKPNLQPFQNFKIDTRRGRIELEAPGSRIVHQITGPGGK